MSEAAISTTSHRTRRLQVLLVEDSIMLANRMAEMLAQLSGIELVAIAHTEAEAISMLHRNFVDVILLDLQLKQGTGFGVLRAVASMAAKPRVIVLTNYDLPQYKTASLALGAACFLDKAHDYPRVPQILQEMVS